MVYSEGYMTCKTFFMLCSNNYKDFMKNCTPIKNLRCAGNIYLFKGNNRITRKGCEISSKLRKELGRSVENLVLCFFIEACIQYFFYQIFIFHQMMIVLQKLQNVFYFIKKALFVLEIFKFLYFCLPLFSSLSAIALEVDPRKILTFMMSSTV